jgi:hypothetical protein
MAPRPPQEQTTHNSAEQRQACVLHCCPYLPDVPFGPSFDNEDESKSEREGDGDLPAEGDAKEHCDGNEREPAHEKDQHIQWAYSPHLVDCIGSITTWLDPAQQCVWPERRSPAVRGFE